ncbi:hypothetical protein GCM10010191_68750 [Actinomadura vinacea]|uniref:Uncharacterized protein n=1 Tax=Actinomadura vinacea TaxID=115336 RepID=A0ABN3JWX5_9ACTN
MLEQADAPRTMKRPVEKALARDGTLHTLDRATMSEAKHPRSAARLGVQMTAHQPEGRPERPRLLDHHNDCLRASRSTATPQSAKSG